MGFQGLPDLVRQMPLDQYIGYFFLGVVPPRKNPEETCILTDGSSIIYNLLTYLSIDVAERALLRMGSNPPLKLYQAIQFKKNIHMFNDLSQEDVDAWKKEWMTLESNLELDIQRCLANGKLCMAKAINTIKLCGYLSNDVSHEKPMALKSPGAESEALTKNKAAIMEAIKIAALQKLGESKLFGFFVALNEIRWQQQRLAFLLGVSQITHRMWVIWENESDLEGYLPPPQNLFGTEDFSSGDLRLDLEVIRSTLKSDYPQLAKLNLFMRTDEPKVTRRPRPTLGS